MANTHEALRAHLAKWRAKNRKRGIEVNPLGALEESVSWLCKHLDAVTCRKCGQVNCGIEYGPCAEEEMG